MSFTELAGRCSGRWAEIVSSLSAHAEMAAAIERGPSRHGLCPNHGGAHGDAFRILDDFDQTGGAACNTCGVYASGFALLAWLNDWSWAEVAKAIEAHLDGGASRHKTSKVKVAPVVARKPQPDKAPPFAVLQRLWSESAPVHGPRAKVLRNYLELRGVENIHPMPTAVRYHPRMLYTERGHREQRQHLPALLSQLTGPTGKMVALLRIYLNEDGTKAEVSTPKKLLRARDAGLTGAAIRLFPAGPVLGVAEGVETALSVYSGTGLPVWAATNTALMASMEVPVSVRRVVIWADADEEIGGKQAGRVAAEKLRDRMREQGKDVDIRYPVLPGKAVGIDWNDVLMAVGPAGFPDVVRVAPPLPSMQALSRAA